MKAGKETSVAARIQLFEFKLIARDSVDTDDQGHTDDQGQTDDQGHTEVMIKALSQDFLLFFAKFPDSAPLSPQGLPVLCS